MSAGSSALSQPTLAPPTAGASPWLYGSRVDLLFGAGLAYLATLPLLFYWTRSTGTASWPTDTTIFLAIAFASPHYGATLMRVYEQRADRRKYALFAVHLTVAMLLLLAAGMRSSLVGSLLLTAYVTWSPWHFAGQNYGISLLFLRRRGVPIDATAKRLLYVSFVLSSALAILAIHTANARLVFAQNAVDDSGGYSVLRMGIPTAVSDWLGPMIGVAYIATLGAGLLRLRRHANATDLSAPVILAATHALWFVLPSIGATTGAYDVTSLAFAPIWISTIHSIQYLWVTCFYAKRARTPIATLPFLVKATLAGALVTRVPALLFAPGLLGASLPYAAGVSVLLFSVVNLHHFVLDGAVWKLRDGRVARALLRGEADASDAAEQEPDRHWLRPLVWMAGLLGLAVIPFTIYERSIAKSPTASVARVHAALEHLDWLGRDTPGGWLQLATRLEAEGRIPEAIAAYRETLGTLRRRKSLPSAEVSSHFAALLLTHERENPAGVREALRLAKFAVQLTPDDPATLEVLAEANACAGNWDAAREVGENALALARARGNSTLVASIERRLRRYRTRDSSARAAESP